MNYYLDENGALYHHGILGQKWGVQNGPPYPLDQSSYSKEEKKHQLKVSKKIAKSIKKKKPNDRRELLSKEINSNTGYLNSMKNEISSMSKKYDDWYEKNESEIDKLFEIEGEASKEQQDLFDEWVKKSDEYDDEKTKIREKYTKMFVNSILGEYGDQPIIHVQSENISLSLSFFAELDISDILKTKINEL